MKRVDGVNDGKFLSGVLVAYFFTFFFSYFYFMAASPIIIGNVIAGIPENDYPPQVTDPILIKTLAIMGLITSILIFVFVIPTIIHRRRTTRHKSHKTNYSPFKNQ